MPVVIPQAIEIIAAFSPGSCHFRFLRFVFGDQNNRAFACCFACCAADRADNIFIGFVVDTLRCIKTESVEVEFLDPIAPVSDVKFAYRSGVPAVEIDGVTPFLGQIVPHVIIRINPEIVSVWPKVIIDDI